MWFDNPSTRTLIKAVQVISSRNITLWYRYIPAILSRQVAIDSDSSQASGSKWAPLLLIELRKRWTSIGSEQLRRAASNIASSTCKSTLTINTVARLSILKKGFRGCSPSHFTVFYTQKKMLASKIYRKNNFFIFDSYIIWKAFSSPFEWANKIVIRKKILALRAQKHESIYGVNLFI